MADPAGFVLPTLDDFNTFISLDPSADVSDYTDSQKTWMIRTGADLMILATGMGRTGVPVPDADSPLGRLVQDGVLDMAFYLGTSFDDRQSQQYSPFSSERLGSYSYSRMFSAVQKKQDTGVSLFDQAVSYFASENSSNTESGQFASSSEHVFSNTFSQYEKDIARDSRWTWGWR